VIRAAAIAAALCCGCTTSGAEGGDGSGPLPDAGSADAASDASRPDDLAFVATDACAGVAPASLSRDVQPILSQRCSGIECHAGYFSNGRTWADTYRHPAPECGGRNYVEPGDPAASYLYDKVAGIDLCDGRQMPLLGDPLSGDEVARIAGWICAGAPDD
jgi:hypothetical protein